MKGSLMKNLIFISLLTLTSTSLFCGDMGTQDDSNSGRKSPMELVAPEVEFGDGDDGTQLGNGGLTAAEITLIEARLKEKAEGPGVEEDSLTRISAARALKTIPLTKQENGLSPEQESALKQYLTSGDEEIESKK